MTVDQVIDLVTAVAGFGAIWRELRALRHDLVGHQVVTEQRHVAVTQRLDCHEERLSELERVRA